MTRRPLVVLSAAVSFLLAAVVWGIYVQGETTAWGVVSGRIDAWIWFIIGLLPLIFWAVTRLREARRASTQNPLSILRNLEGAGGEAVRTSARGQGRGWDSVLAITPILLGAIPFTPDILLGAPEHPRGLKVIAFNIEHGAKGHDRLGQYLQSQDPDILLLQEAGPLEKFPGFASPELRSAFADREIRQSRYELIAVKGKILASGSVPLPRTELERDRNSPKTLLWVTASVKGKTMTLMSPHLSPTWAGEAIKNGDFFKQIRQVSIAKSGQIATIRRILRNRPGPAIVGGDFNMRMAGPLYEGLKQDAQDVVAQKSRGFEMNRIDGIFARGFTPVRAELGPSDLSDHRPVIVWLD